MYRNGTVLTATVSAAAAILIAGCAGATVTRQADAGPARARFCAVEVSPPTAAQEKALRRFWTPLARSAFVVVTQGKMSYLVPRKRLTPAQRRAVRRVEAAERRYAFSRQRRVCAPATGHRAERRGRARVLGKPH